MGVFIAAAGIVGPVVLGHVLQARLWSAARRSPEAQKLGNRGARVAILVAVGVVCAGCVLLFALRETIERQGQSAAPSLFILGCWCVIWLLFTLTPPFRDSEQDL